MNAPSCPAGHASETPDFCSVCGAQLAAAAPPPGADPAPVSAPDLCPVCRTPRESTAPGDFCEICGCHFATGAGAAPTSPPPGPAAPATAPAGEAPATPAPSAPPDPPAPPVVDAPPPASPAAATLPAASARWELVATVAPDLRGAVDPEAPRDLPARVFPLDLDELLVGRRSPRRDLVPEVAFPDDDGVSHRHARILRQPDGTFAWLDLGSANGSRHNGREVAAHVPTPLREGDTVELGRWTRLRVRARRPGAAANPDGVAPAPAPAAPTPA